VTFDRRAEMAELARRPSATRGASIARARRVAEARKGNTNAMRHGAFAQVNAAGDVATELALLEVAYPHLTIADRRLLELLATTRVSVARAFLALSEPEGIRSSVLTAFLSRQSALAERLERQVRDLDAARSARRVDADPLAGYRVEPR
jgi:hypothetical protein